jgi:MFS family permease
MSESEEKPTVILGSEAPGECDVNPQAQPELTTIGIPKWRQVMIIFSLCVGTLLVAIDTTIIAVAVPRIASDFGVLGDVGWYGSAYLLTVTAFQPAFGSIYRDFDPKRTYLTSIVLFEGTVVAHLLLI